MNIKYYALAGLNLIKVTKDDGILGDSYVIEGLSADPSFWVQLWKKDKTTCITIASRVWGKLPTPTLMGYYNEKGNLKELALVDSIDVSSFGNIGINTSNPFDLNEEDLTLLKDKQQKVELEKEKRWEAIEAKKDGLFLKVQELLKNNPNLVIPEGKRRRGYIEVIVEGVEVSTIRLEDFYKKVFPED